MTGAARVLHVTQPTLSRQLQELEEELGQKLFVRGSHSVTLTPEGMLLRKRAEEILDMVRKTETEFGSLGETAAGEVHIGGGETEAMRQIARIIGELQQEHPRLRFHLYSGNAEDVTERLDKGLLDFGLLIQPVDITRYHSLRLPDQEELPAGRQNGGHPPGSGRPAVDLFAAGHAADFPGKRLCRLVWRRAKQSEGNRHIQPDLQCRPPGGGRGRLRDYAG